jgi:hypothetical protein
VPVRYARRDPPAPVAASHSPAEALPPGAPPAVPTRSHVAAFVAIAMVLLGWYLAHWTVIAPALLAFFLLSAGVTFLGTRLNPLSIGFYLTVKPSWTAIGAVFLGGLLLMGIAYSAWKSGSGPIIPHHLWP